MLNPEIREKSPELVQEIERLQQFDGSYDFTNVRDQANFAEALHMLGRFLAMHSQRGRISIGIGGTGITSVGVDVLPR